MLGVGCWVLGVGCWVLCVVCCVLCVACFGLCAVCCVLGVGCGVWCAVSYMICVVCCVVCCACVHGKLSTRYSQGHDFHRVRPPRQILGEYRLPFLLHTYIYREILEGKPNAS